MSLKLHANVTRRTIFAHSVGFFPSSFLALLGVNHLEHLGHQLHLGTRYYGENILVKVNCTPLVFCLRKHFTYGFQYTKELVANHQFDPIQVTAMQPLEEADPADLVLLHVIGGAENLSAALLVHSNSYQNGYIFKLSAPVVAQV